MLNRNLRGAAVLMFCAVISQPAFSASQDKYNLPEPFLGMEKSYLSEAPDLQKVLDVMIATSERQLKDPSQDILHNRLCAAFVYKMAMDQKMPPTEKRQALAGDLLHNIAKEEKEAVLTNPAELLKARSMVADLRKAGYFKNSPHFWGDEQVLTNPKIGDNRALIHNITGAVMAGELLNQIGGFSKQQIETIEAAIAEHSTGYWYFRASIDEAAGKKGAWENVYPEPENDIAKFTHDADLISQFVPDSVVPEGSKWRTLAQKRWGAKTPQEEGHIVYYVFQRLFDEAKTPSGKEMARERWDIIAPALVKLSGLKEGEDPTKVLGVPAVFSK